MYDFFDKIEHRLQRYKEKYAAYPRFAALKLAIWNMLRVFFIYRKLILKPDNKIALAIHGGLGDYIIAVNFAQHLYDYLDKKTIIDIYVKNPENIKKLFSDDVPFNFFDKKAFLNQTRYSLKLSLNRFPEIICLDAEYIRKQQPKLIPLISAWKRINDEASIFFKLDPQADALTIKYAQINGCKRRIQQPDIDGLLKIGTDYKLRLRPNNKEDILRKFGLSSCKFITINRGTDVESKSNEVSRMWPLEYYNTLAKQLKKKFPQYKIVQLGYSATWCKPIEHTDVDLRGKTSLSDLKALLHQASLHIDYEGGMVHLRRALKAGKSIVLFGPTSPEWLGYENNINIYSHKCLGCENLHPSWQVKCSNHKFPHVCMTSIAPDLVFKAVAACLNNK